MKRLHMNKAMALLLALMMVISVFPLNVSAEDVLPTVEGDVLPPVEGDALPPVEGDVLPPVEGDVLPPVEEDVLPPVEEDVIPDTVPAEQPTIESPDPIVEEPIAALNAQLDILGSGTCGGETSANITWVLDNDGVLTLEGTGPMADFVNNTNNANDKAPWYGKRGSIKHVYIGEGITSIGNYAFQYANVEKITWPTTVVSIGSNAFNGAPQLKEVIIPASVVSIGESAFQGCSALESVSILGEVTVINKRTFRNCRKLTSLILPDSLVEIVESAFESCTSLDHVVFPEGLTSIGKNAFKSCEALQRIELPQSLTTISTDAFRSCLELKSVTLPDNLNEISEGLFRYCAKLTSVSMPKNLTAIGKSAFDGCNALPSISIPSGVRVIEESAFNNCSALSAIEFPSALTEIKGSAFSNCVSLTDITIPKNVTSIGEGPFSGCLLLQEIKVEEGSTNFRATEGVLYNGDGTILIQYPAGRGTTELTVPASVQAIGSSAFEGTVTLSSITFNDGLSSLGSYAFQDCVNLLSIELPENITVINAFTFTGCTNLNSVTIKGDVTFIDNSAFKDCTMLKSIEFPDSLQGIGMRAFENSGLTGKLIIPAKVETLGASIFKACESITSAEIWGKVSSLPNELFMNCTALSEAVIPASVTSIGQNAFGGSRLGRVEFTGSPGQWAAISKTDILAQKALVRYYYTGIEGERQDAPIITKQPENLSVKVNSVDVSDIFVEIQLPSGEDKVYFTWYLTSENSSNGGLAITSDLKLTDTECSFKPDVSVVGTLYYYCVITKVDQNNARTTTVSDIVTVVTKPDISGFEGEGTSDNPYLLKNQEDLEKVKARVDSGEALADVYFALADNIELSQDWTPIGKLKDGAANAGNGKNIHPFSGIFDGRNFTVTVHKGGRPLFGYVRSTTIQNLNIYGEYIDGYGLIDNYVVDYGEDGDYNKGTGGKYAPGCPHTAELINVTIKSGTVIKRSGFLGGYASGGNVVNIIGCKVEEDVKIGWNGDKDKPFISDRVGSFGGEFNGTVTGSVSYADVYGKQAVGGLVGCKGQSMGPFEIKNSSFHGTVTASGEYAGGIVGEGYYSSTAPNSPAVSIDNCYATGSIQGSDRVGGIFGGESSIAQSWDSNKGYIRNNHFAGSVTATLDNAKYLGGVIGFMKSLNRNNIIENNYYVNSSGAPKGFGGALYIDTDQYSLGWADGVYYMNTAVDNLATINNEIDPNSKFTVIARPNCNRSDDPLGSDAHNLARPMTPEQFADQTVVNLLNGSDSSLKNWVQDKNYPVTTSKPIPHQLIVSGAYKTEYYIGEALDLSGMIFTVKWSDGSTTTPVLSANDITGFDSSKRAVLTLTATYGATTAKYNVKILKATAPENSKITVRFSLLGAPVHNSESDGIVYALKNNNLETWIAGSDYIVDYNATVETVFQMALQKANLKFKGNTGNQYNSIYISGIQIPGTQDEYLEEFTNGPLSGWMYTLNGKHPDVGISAKFMESGDVIVFHYTDDYTIEEGSEKWNNSSDEPSDNLTVTPDATVTNGEAKVKLTLDELKAAIGSAKDGKEPIVIDPKVDGSIDSLSAEISKDALTAIAAQTSSALEVKTLLGSITIPNDVILSVTSQSSGDTVTVKLGVVDTAVLTETQQMLVGGNQVYDISILSGSKAIQSFGGKSITIALPYTLKNGEDAAGVRAWYLSDSGELELMTGRYDEATKLMTFTTTHLSKYVVGYESEWENPFTDVKDGDWHFEAVKYAVKNQLFNGISETTFEPDASMTRAMLVTVLYRMEGKPSATQDNGFTDVKDGQWYTDAILWASESKIVDGYGNGEFGTNDAVTREQLAVILYRYAQAKKYDVTKATELMQYVDASAVSTWATAAMKWANAEQLITGTTGTTLSPAGTATRAQVATILMRFSQNIGK